MICNVKQYQTRVKIVDDRVFGGNIRIPVDLAITTLCKTQSDNDLLQSCVTKSGKEYRNVDISDINMTDMNTEIYRKLRGKIATHIATTGHIQSLITTTPSDKKLYLQKIRGDFGKSSFYTFVSADPKYHNIDRTSDWGLKIRNNTELQYLLSYLKSHIARFCLSIYKFNANSHRGELKGFHKFLSTEFGTTSLCVSILKLQRKSMPRLDDVFLTTMPTLNDIINHIRNHSYMSGAARDALRIKATGEVFTPTALVQEMLANIPIEVFADPTKTVLDNSCGDGQFLGEIIIRKIETGSTLEQALSTTYGVELMADNHKLCQERLLCGREDLRHIVEKNIVCADALTYHYRFDSTAAVPQTLEQLFN